MSEKKICPACGEGVRESSQFCCFCEHVFEPTGARGSSPDSAPAGGLDSAILKIGVALMVLGALAVFAAIAIF